MSHHRALYLSQDRIIDILNRFLSHHLKNHHIHLDEKGVCAGLVATYLIKKAEGNSADFLAKIKKIILLNPSDYAVEASWIAEFCQDIEKGFHMLKGIPQGDLDKLFSNHTVSIQRTVNHS